MLFRLLAGSATIGTLLVLSPEWARTHHPAVEDPGVVARRLLEAGPAAALALPAASAVIEEIGHAASLTLQPGQTGQVGGATGEAPGAVTGRTTAAALAPRREPFPPLDTLRPQDRRPAWRGTAARS